MWSALFTPRKVALVGSVGEGRLGYHLLRQMVDGGFPPARLAVVNPKGQGALGVRGYPSVAAIGGPVDLAVIVTPAATVPAVLEECAQAGARAAVVITAGFSEVGNVAGEEAIREVVGRTGIRVVGPNCAGIVNTHHALFPTLETRPPTGGVSLVAQSGAVGGVFLAWAREHGLGIAKFVSYGNGADLTERDFLAYLAEDPETQVVALYIEEVTEGRDFLRVLADCARRKPVIVIKAGRTEAGRRATLSHTGSIAGADAVYDAALRQCGALRVTTLEEMFDLCLGFTALPPVRGRRVVIVTNSGGPGVLAADRAEEVGLTVAEPSPALRERLSVFLPPYCGLSNPIDLTVEGTEEGYRRTLAAVLEEYDAAVALNIAPAYLDSVPLARGVVQAARESGKPVAAAFLPGPIVAEAVGYLREHGVPNFATGERAVAALARLAEYYATGRSSASLRSALQTPLVVRHEAQRSAAPLVASPEAQRSAAPLVASPEAQRSAAPLVASPEAQQSAAPLVASPEAQQSAAPLVVRHEAQRSAALPASLLEPDLMAWLRAIGIPVPEFHTARTADEAVAAARALGYPVVMKVVSPQILHKSEVGGVLLGLADDEAVRAGFERLAAVAAGRDFRGVVLYPLIQGAQEVLVGLFRDPQFGPVVAFGAGGIYTELLRDVALRVAPVDREEARAMVRETRVAALLAGARGRPPGDLDALADLIARVSELPFRYPDIAEMDLNPVFVLPQGVQVGDVRLIRKESDASVLSHPVAGL